MRLTVCLRKQPLNWIFKQQWKVKGQRKIIECDAIEKLEALGIKPLDAVEYTSPPLQKERVVFPEPWGNEDLFKEKTDHPDWHDRICHFFTEETCLLEGEAHAQVLTKTLCKSGLPSLLELKRKEAEDLLEPKHMDRVQYAVQQSRIWDTYQEKLPKIIDRERLWFNYKRVYGIPQIRQIRLLLNSLLRLSETCSLEFAGNLERSCLSDIVACVPLEKDGDLLQYRVKIPLMVASELPLPTFASNEEITSTESTPLPDIYPLKHTLDLKQENVYKNESYFSVPRESRHPHIHTVFIPHTWGSFDEWNRTQALGRAIGVCYAMAVAQARQQYGNSTKSLPRPISLQGVQTDGRTFDFIAYQLNTLNDDGIDGIKNLAWVDGGHQLFEQCERVDGKAVFTGFNDNVFKKFLALYLSGLQ